MMGTRWLLFLAMLALAAAPLWWVGSGWGAARTDLASAHRAQSRVGQDIAELQRLDRARERVGLQPRPSQDVHGQAEAVLAALALDERLIKQTTQETDVSLPANRAEADGQRYHRQTLRLNMQGIGIDELGLFLTKWRADHPVWTPTRIDLTRRTRRRGIEDGHFNALVYISTIYIEDGI